MPTRRHLIFGSAALAGAGLWLAACSDGKAPSARAAAPAGEPIDITVPPSPASALVIIAQARRLWGEAAANLVLASDDVTLVRGFNSELVEFGALTLERFLFWRSGGSKLQLAAWASREARLGASLVYAVREDMPDQAAQLGRFIAGLKAADAWMRTHADEAARLIAEQVGTLVDAASLGSLVAGTEVNRTLLAAAADGENQSMKAMRPLDEAMREDGSAGHQAFLPEIIAAGAAAAWAL